MSLQITDAARTESQRVSKTPQLVVKFEGLDTVFGMVDILHVARYGDLGIEYGLQDLRYGGLLPLKDQETLISTSGTTSTIKQKLEIAKGKGSSISNLTIRLIDKEREATKLITPGNKVAELLGRNTIIYLGFQTSDFPNDYIVIFRGIVDDIEAGAGFVDVSIAHPDQKKRSEIFQKIDTELNGAISDTDTTLTVDDASDLLAPVTGPDGTIDDDVKYHVLIDNELIEYNGISGNDLTGLVRGKEGTTAASHNDGAAVSSLPVLEGNAIDLALKLMLSGWNGPFKTGVEIQNFQVIDPTTKVDNAIFLQDINVSQEIGAVPGDFVTITGATKSANNTSLKPIVDVVTVVNGSYVVVGGGVDFEDETDTGAVVDFRSQYDTLGEGLKMAGFEVDVLEHEDLRGRFLPAHDYKFFLKDTIKGKKFLAEQIYNPAAAFQIPRKARASVGYHIPPLPEDEVKILDSTNILNPNQLKIRRTITKNFFNNVIYKFDEQLTEDRFLTGVVTANATSLSRIPVGKKSLVIEAKGLRKDKNGVALANTATSRRLRKYKFGAEFIPNVKVNFETSFTIEIGDIVLLDLESLKLSDIQTGDRVGEPRLFEVTDRKFDWAKGVSTIELTDTNFDKDARFAVISPASKIAEGFNGTSFLIKQSFGGFKFGRDEWRKWRELLGATVRVRSEDFSTLGSAELVSLSGNVVTVGSDLGFTPSANMVMELDKYSTQPDIIKTLFVFLSDDGNNFADGKPPYQHI